MNRLQATVAGKVQGVYFRAHARQQAEQLGLSGYALNLPDGRVEVVAEGEQSALEALLAWLHRGPPAANVRSVNPRWGTATGEFGSFEVRP